MVEFASDTMFDILSRLPAKTLGRFRCVSKPWCAYIDDDHLSILHGTRAVEELTPIMYDPNLSSIISFDIIKSEEGEITLEAKKGNSLESELYKSCSTDSRYLVGGSCNGLLYLSIQHIPYTISLAVIHPLRKEVYKLPPMQQRLVGPYYLIQESRGLGFDVSTNTFKMVLVLSKTGSSKNETIIKNLCTMVHVLGMDKYWREISQVPPYPTSGYGVFAHGCLYWLGPYPELQSKTNYRGEVICFDLRNEEFTLICPPKRRCGYYVSYQLVDLQGEIGYAYYSDNIIEVWVLKQNQWVKHCQLPRPHGQIKVLGRWNKYGDILMKSSAVGTGRSNWFVYSLKSRVLDQVKIVGHEYGHGLNAYMYMYPASSMFSIRSINKTSHSIKS